MNPDTSSPCDDSRSLFSGEFMAAAIDRKILFREDLCLQAGCQFGLRV